MRLLIGSARTPTSIDFGVQTKLAPANKWRQVDVAVRAKHITPQAPACERVISRAS